MGCPMFDLLNAMIAWNPNSAEAAVGIWPDRLRWSRHYAYTSGACDTDIHKMTDDQQKRFLLATFNAMVIRDGVDPKAAHQALLGIRQYREAIALDVEGAAP